MYNDYQPEQTFCIIMICLTSNYLYLQEVSHYKTTLHRKRTVVCVFVLPERIQKAVGFDTSFARAHPRETL